MEEKDYVSLIKDELIRQCRKGEKGNLYHDLQVTFAYNSNKIEGSRLSEDDTAMIYETNSLIAKEDQIITADDIIETRNHFSLFKYTLDHLQDSISSDLVLRMHAILKRATSDEDDPRYNVGGYKTSVNQIGFLNPISVTDPADVEEEINILFSKYEKKEQHTFEDIVDFHVAFERIHPFSDGNGRIGRMLMFKECLRNGSTPFIISDQNRAFYIRGLREYGHINGYLLDTCLTEQDTLRKKVAYYLGVEFDQENSDTSEDASAAVM